MEVANTSQCASAWAAKPRARASVGQQQHEHQSAGRHHRVLQTLLVLSLTLLQQKVASALGTNAREASKASAPNQRPTQIDEREIEDDDLLVTTHEDDEHDPFAYKGRHFAMEDVDFISSEDQNETGEEDILIVSTVTGDLVGISKSSGNLVWKQSSHHTNQHSKPIFQTGANNKPNVKRETVSESPSLLEPLIATTTTTQSFVDRDWRTAAVPSLDGKTVYLTANVQNQAAEGDGDHEITVTTSIQDLVRRAPFVDNRGRIYNGSRSTVAVAVDGLTGEIIKVISTNGDSLFDREGGEEDDDLHWEEQKEGESYRRRRQVVWLGRVDHSISVHEPKSGNLDVSFSAAEIKSVRDMILGKDHHQPPWEAAAESESPLFLSSGSAGQFGGGINGEAGDEDDSRPNSLWKAVTTTTQNSWVRSEQQCSLLATPDGNLALRNPSTGEIEWVSPMKFDSPVAFAVDSSSGSTVHIDMVPDAVNQQVDGTELPKEHLSKELTRQYNNLMKAPTTAAAASSRKGDESGKANEKMDPLVGSLPDSGQLFAIPLGRGGTSSSDHAQGLLTAGTTAASHAKPGRISSLLSAVVAVTGRPHTTYEHSSTSATSPATKRPCFPGMKHFPGCLVSSSNGDVRSSAGLIEPEAKTTEYEIENALVPFGQDYSTEDDSQGEDLPPSPRPPPHRKYQKMLMVLGSWLPPTLALIFVVSFELGRRKRQKDKGDGAPLDLIGSTHDGVIQVNHNVILGYGGHGTVVYEGMLEGRKVAVKRMLQAYNANADREISLLIESDGHPNVVRYFLKEVRDDFVYLALELCDLSLHDLIGHIRATYDVMQNENWFETEVVSIPNAVRNVLFQIASGIRHLHGLRIVHRDLKPANILLADARKSKRKGDGDMQESVFEIFSGGDYVAKISDMGLGKQLMGQSSYGASGAGASSLRVQANGEASNQPSIVGAGPGTVGWQAPEVMIMRMPAPSDTSVRSNDSARGAIPSTGDFSQQGECSPLDGFVAARTSRSVDIFSLGCVFYSVLVPGSHPFGEWYEREANIMHNKPDLDALRDISVEALDLISSMVRRNPAMRPSARQVCEHPYFWQLERRLLFLCDFSDLLETEGLGINDDLATPTSQGSDFAKVMAVERNAVEIVGTSWDKCLDMELVSNVQKFRTYDPSSVRDLLRLIRNKYHHFDELPEAIKSAMGSKAEGLSSYFEKRFPSLLVHCFNTCREILPADDPFCEKYAIPAAPKLKTVDVTTATIPEAIPESASRSLSQDTPGLSHDSEVGASGESEQLPEAVPMETETLDSLGEPAVLRPCSSFDFDGCSSLVESEFVSADDAGDVVVWECSTAAKTFNNRGWFRSDDDWIRRTDAALARKPNSTLTRCMDDPKFRTRLCNHWDASMGRFCPMRRKGKCVFAHGPVELRVKEAKRNRWGKLVDADGNNKNPRHSGGEDTYGAARSIESERKSEGKWNLDKKTPGKGAKKATTETSKSRKQKQ
mmetsp:Transcript_15090/g.32995  ORF Transcript_15090/g.32995 Transcript_15090/m.32995 type:complete len:1483 (-) Transcript_15090:66-4514(-)